MKVLVLKRVGTNEVKVLREYRSDFIPRISETIKAGPTGRRWIVRGIEHFAAETDDGFRLIFVSVIVDEFEEDAGGDDLENLKGARGAK